MHVHTVVSMINLLTAQAMKGITAYQKLTFIFRSLGWSLLASCVCTSSLASCSFPVSAGSCRKSHHLQEGKVRVANVRADTIYNITVDLQTSSMTSKMFDEKHGAQETADAIVQKASVALAEKGKHGLGSNSTVQGLPTTEAITDKIMKEGARKLAHDGSEMAAEAQVICVLELRSLQYENRNHVCGLLQKDAMLNSAVDRQTPHFIDFS